MNAVRVDIPNILRLAIGVDHLEIAAPTVREALAQLRAHPKLGPLIFDESAELRKHVIVFVNDTSTHHLPTLDVELKPSDRLAVVQAVSGG